MSKMIFIGVDEAKKVNMNLLSKNALSLSLQTFVRILFPSRCLVCNASTCESGSSLCVSCRSSLPVISGAQCRCCGKPFVAQFSPAHTCGDCLESPPAFTSVRSYAVYEGIIAGLLKQLKYNQDTTILPLIRELNDQFLALLPSGIDLILPVPLHKSRLRNRGYNQSLLLARAMFPDHRAIIVPDVLKRVENTVSQTGLSRKERADNLRDAFKIMHPRYVREKNICLVDDIYTTGATINECAKKLIKYGACEVHGVTVARTMLLGKRR